MRWLVCLISLVTFVAQQLVCCCDGTTACQHSHSAPAQTEPQVEVVHHCGHHHTTSAQCDQADAKCHHNDDCDSHGHQHHLCVGTHVFYKTVDTFAAPVPLLLWSTVSVEDLLNLKSGQAELPSVDSDLALCSAPDRATLGVYVL
ncbi:hypothetical protein [Planctomicrobium piriforme]|uniref:Secreted protein n=1 Tax=Planctomicrobium piriforme TaxID=1576369 RepID=A0A1I3M1L7_9PLAN|nr:hypothetical protein [Planctomicrobium piriforme]SFI90904.1 hypothetical protein SAMN05421753_113132 [Planctomicrobium piriforme]